MVSLIRILKFIPHDYLVWESHIDLERFKIIDTFCKEGQLFVVLKEVKSE